MSEPGGGELTPPAHYVPQQCPFYLLRAAVALSANDSCSFIYFPFFAHFCLYKSCFVISTRHSKANAKPETKNYSLCPHIPKGVLIDTGMSRFQLSLPKVERRRLKSNNRINLNPRVSPSSETPLYLCKLSIRNVL